MIVETAVSNRTRVAANIFKTKCSAVLPRHWMTSDVACYDWSRKDVGNLCVLVVVAIKNLKRVYFLKSQYFFWYVPTELVICNVVQINDKINVIPVVSHQLKSVEATW